MGGVLGWHHSSRGVMSLFYELNEQERAGGWEGWHHSSQCVMSLFTVCASLL